MIGDEQARAVRRDGQAARLGADRDLGDYPEGIGAE
jgi:hypothetical protein